MTVVVNGRPERFDAPVRLADVLARAGHAATTGVAVACNGAVVRRAAWDDFQLHDGDRVEILVAAQGG